MRLRDAEIRSLPVFTKSGQRVGKISGVFIDATAHVVTHYAVTKSRTLSRLLPAELLVQPPQVISLDQEKMVVQDAVVEAEAAARLELPEAIAGAVSHMSSSIKG